MLPLAEVVLLGIGVPYAKSLMKAADTAAEKVPALKEQFKQCEDAYFSILMDFKVAAKDLKSSPTSANYETIVCLDQTTRVDYWIGKNKDSTSKSLMELNMHMEKVIHLAIGATEAVGG
ncbi:hypothetical protein CARUB_v10021821mg [Capsella rubella]|uniref:Pectinesterase inhibitor domain-containing protein n=1 Tax=Capsella rubella TaxID=81985 RepID=R0ICC7_9BRAS|nr:hypothetical protein CARUB_v10021821mg [Capsella rubella]